MRAVKALIFIALFTLAFAFGFSQGERSVILNQEPYFDGTQLLIEYRHQTNVYDFEIIEE